MATVAITGWKKGCNSVAAIKLIREKTPMPLNEALSLVDQVLADKEVLIQVVGSDAAKLLIGSLGKVGITAIGVDDRNTDRLSNLRVGLPGGAAPGP